MKDEHYILNLCDEVLSCGSSRQQRFDFLRGETSPKRKKGTKLPVDAYYETYNLVIEYHERQHSEHVKVFDNKMTCSGVTRGEQRKIYDQRRRDLLPQNGITLIEFSYSDFKHKKNKRLQRIENEDRTVIYNKLKNVLLINHD